MRHDLMTDLYAARLQLWLSLPCLYVFIEATHWRRLASSCKVVISCRPRRHLLCRSLRPWSEPGVRLECALTASFSGHRIRA